MAKKTSSPHQSSLFRRELPRMPDGYYTPGPNPNLRRFVEEHAKPYDPAADDYNVPPFDQPITTTKATAIYNMHTYWSKKPHDAIRQYIRHYTQPGDLVLDPFSGSGGTALAALMEGRAAVAIDLSPAATFITKNYCTPVDVGELQRAFEQLKAKVKPELDWLYETRCDRCDGRATTAYTVYSYVFECPRCLSHVPLFDCPEVQTEAGKAVTVCPACQERGIVEEISTRSCKRFEPIPVLVSYLCEEGCKPQRGERRHNDSDPKKRAFFQKYDLGKLAEIERRPIPYWYPPHRMMNIESDTEPWGDKWRAGTSNFRTVSELFTKRNLWALALLFANINEVEDKTFSDCFKIAGTGFLLALSKMQRYYPGSSFPNMTLPGTYYMPPVFSEENVPTYFYNKHLRNVKGIEQINEALSPNRVSCLISTQSATSLHEISSASVDYIYTDPPYSNNIQYGELNFIWEAWLNLPTNWHDNEIIINNTRGKTEQEWVRMMTMAMNECFRILKPGRWISLCYHDTSEGTWELLQDLMTEVGFIPDRTSSTLYIDTEQKSFNQITAEKVNKRDLVINFRRPDSNEIVTIITISGEEDKATFVEKARAILTEALEKHPGSTADRLYDELVSRMVRRGEFQRHNFDELLRTVAEESHGRWYLLETAGQVDEAEGRKEAAAAQRLEAFMRSQLAGRAGALAEGVHYSDLFEQYLPVSDKPRRALVEWLPEFFYKTETASGAGAGTWRPPKDDEERQAKAGLRATGILRRIKRFAGALGEGVPPAARDLPGNAATLADWVYQCRRAGLYELGRVLYEQGGLRFDGLDEEMQLQVEEDYQLCVRRSEKKEDKPKKKGKKSGQLELDLPELE